MPTARTLIEDAMLECGIISEAEVPESEDIERGLRILNRDIMDPWNAIRNFAQTRVITSGTFLANTQTRSIGPSGNYSLTTRPIDILAANRVDSNSIRYALRVRPYADFHEEDNPTFASTYPTDLYYSPTVPTGTMYAWPIPTGNTTIEVVTLAVLATFDTLDTSANFAPGYEHAISETLKEFFCRAWQRPMPEGLETSARKARAAIQIVNAAFHRRPAKSDAPSTMSGAVGSDITGFRTRSF